MNDMNKIICFAQTYNNQFSFAGSSQSAVKKSDTDGHALSLSLGSRLNFGKSGNPDCATEGSVKETFTILSRGYQMRNLKIS